MVELFVQQLVPRGIVVDWIMQRSEAARDAPDVVGWNGCRVYLTPRSTRSSKLRRILDWLLGFVGDFKALRLALRNRYDVIQVRDKFASGLIALLAARISGARFCYWMSYPFPEEWLYLARSGLSGNTALVQLCKGHFASFALYRILLRFADHVFVQSERMRDTVAAKGIAPQKITAVPMGIHADQILSADAAERPNPEAPVLLYLGTLFRVRHLDFLIRVIGLVRERFPNVTLKMIGEGYDPRDRAVLDDEIERLDLRDNVEFTGFMPMEQAWEEVRKSDICLSPIAPLPILQVGSPTKLIEYLALAKPVVASEHPDQSRILRESGAGLCVPWEEKAFADGICRFLDDPEMARRMAARGPAYIALHRSYDVLSEPVERIYRNLVVSEHAVVGAMCE